MDIKAFPDNIQIVPPNFRDLAFVTEFYDRRSGIDVNVDSITLTREMYARAYKWIYQEQGRFEGAAATVTTNDGTVLDYYLDFQDAVTGLDTMEVGFHKRKSFNQFFEDADVLIWKVVKNKGFLPDSLRLKVPYIIVPDDLIQQQAFTIGQVLFLSYQLYTAIFETAKAVAAALDFIGTGIATAIAQAASLVIFFAATLISLIQALSDLQELFFPTLRYLHAYRDYDLINEACKALGYTLESDLLQNELYNLCTLGKPEGKDAASVVNFVQNQLTITFNEGYPTAQDSTPTLGTLITYIEETYNARTLVYDGVVRIERRSTYTNTASVLVKPTLTDQENKDDVYRYHTQEDWGRCYDHYQIDFNDVHSPDQEEGVRAEHITTQINTINEDLVRLTGLKENSVPFALAGRKNSYTRVEELVIGLFGNFFNVLAQLPGNTQPVLNFTNRLGVMIIESQFFSVTKKMWLEVDDNGLAKQPANYKDFLSLDKIYDEYKTDLEVNVNNRIIQEFTVPFTDQNFIDLQLNNFVLFEQPSGQVSVVELMNVEYFDRQYKANLRILLPDNSAFNTQTIKIT